MIYLIISSLLLALSFFTHKLGFLVFIGFIPLFLALEYRSYIRSFFISFFVGFLFYVGALYWLYHVTVIGLLILSFYLAIYFGIFGIVVNHLSRITRKTSPITHYPLEIVFIPLVWIILEYIQANLFTGFGWTLLGYSQYKNLALIQIADRFGVYGVSFIVMMVNISIYRMFKNSFKEAIISIIVLSTVLVYGEIKINEDIAKKSINVSVVQANIPQKMKWKFSAKDSIIEKYSALTEMSSLDKSDLVLWPETSFPGFFKKDMQLTNEVLDLAKDVKAPLLIGTNTLKYNDYFNSAVLISKEGKMIDKYDKIHLVPFGEYVPGSDRFPALRDFIMGSFGEFTPGKDLKVFSLSEDVKFSTLICFEDVFPGLAKEFVKRGAQFLVVVTNDAWYGNSPAAYQHTACSVFRAIENRVSVVRCANTGYSCFIDPHGRIYDDVNDKGKHLFISGYKTSPVKY